MDEAVININLVIIRITQHYEQTIYIHFLTVFFLSIHSLSLKFSLSLSNSPSLKFSLSYSIELEGFCSKQKEPTTSRE